MSFGASWVLLATAAAVAVVHTAIGVDHTLPFVALARAEGWSLRKTWRVTAWCGLGHVGSSVLMGLVGLGVGVALDHLNWLEALRGRVAANALIAFGLGYAAWSFVRRQRGHQHTHEHVHADGTRHVHTHAHAREHLHAHETRNVRTFWALFIVFGLGPCEPLIPLLLVPGLEHAPGVAAALTAVFTVATIGTMIAIVTLALRGLEIVRLSALEKHAEPLAGLAIATSGVVIQVFGL